MTKAEKINVGLNDRSYPILIGPNLLKAADTYLYDFVSNRHCIVISDTTIGPIYQNLLAKTISPICCKLNNLRVPSGENSKSLSVFTEICNDILNIGIDRNTILIALGGGVIGDLVGFASASLLRGIDYIQIPTSLLAQVDSSVGGKTGINAQAGKNLIGAFHQPKIVLTDTNLLNSLSKRELLSGYAEIVKYGLLGDANFFKWLEKNWSDILDLKQDKVIYAIKRSCEMKAEIVASDETEKGMRALLNLGHTFAHAFEAIAKYNGELLHGEAVAAGLGLAFDFSYTKQLCSKEDAARVRSHLAQTGLPYNYASLPAGKAPIPQIIEHMRKDKKTVSNELTFILANRIGKACVVQNISEEEISSFFIAKGVNHV